MRSVLKSSPAMSEFVCQSEMELPFAERVSLAERDAHADRSERRGKADPDAVSVLEFLRRGAFFGGDRGAGSRDVGGKVIVPRIQKAVNKRPPGENEPVLRVHPGDPRSQKLVITVSAQGVRSAEPVEIAQLHPVGSNLAAVQSDRRYLPRGRLRVEVGIHE